MIAISYKVVDSAISTLSLDLNKFKSQILTNLNSLLTENSANYKKKYINHIISNIDDIVCAKPEEIEKLKKDFDVITKPANKKSKAYKSFINKILFALEYEKRRSDFYPNYFYKIGIKACVYCNAHLTVAIEVRKQLIRKLRLDYLAKFQVDHFLPKDDYPCFSISLYNLYPVCANCNNAKSKRLVGFKLYAGAPDFESSQFKFLLKKGTVANYLSTRNPEKIEYEFREPDVVEPVKTFQEVFKIQEIYDTQKDIAEELILKAEIYTEEYKKSLKNQFPILFKSPAIFNRLLLGNYHLENQIHLRPMAKFTIDIAKQVGLIKKKK